MTEYALPAIDGSPALIGRTAAPISVGLPVYNGEPYLERSMRTLLAQDVSDFELVIADNCSTDGTEETCRDFARQDSRVRYLRRERNVGVIENHNRLVHETAGPLLAYAASDDEYDPRWLRLLMDALAAAPNAVLAFSAALEIDSNNAVIGRWQNSCRTDHPNPAIRLHDLFAVEHPFVQLYGVMRRESLLRTRLQPAMKSSDRMLLAELVLRGPFAYVPDELLRRRQHAKKTSEALRPRDFYPADRRLILPNIDEGRYLASVVARAPLTRVGRLKGAFALRTWLRRNAVPMARNLARAGIDTMRSSSAKQTQ